MRHESKRSTLAGLIAVIVPIIVLVGCGGAETPESAGTPGVAGTSDVADAEAYAITGSKRTDEPVRVAKPRGTKEVYEEIMHALDSAWSDLGSPPADSGHLSDVQEMASKQLAGVAFEWPSGTSYSLAVIDDRVTVYINCDGQEKRGTWVPGGDVEQPS